jgi:hypothetical protein
MPRDLTIMDWIAVTIFREDEASGRATKLASIARAIGIAESSARAVIAVLREHGLVSPPRAYGTKTREKKVEANRRERTVGRAERARRINLAVINGEYSAGLNRKETSKCLDGFSKTRGRSSRSQPSSQL